MRERLHCMNAWDSARESNCIMPWSANPNPERGWKLLGKPQPRSEQSRHKLRFVLLLANQNVLGSEQVKCPGCSCGFCSPFCTPQRSLAVAGAVGKWESRGGGGISKRSGKPPFGFPRSGFSTAAGRRIFSLESRHAVRPVIHADPAVQVFTQ